MAANADLLAVIRHLRAVQIDPVARVERNQHLVLHARIPAYHPQQLEVLLEQGAVFEYRANEASILPMEDYPLFEGIRRRIQARVDPQLKEMAPYVRAVLSRIDAEGALPSRAFQSSKRVHGYWDNSEAKTKATSHALNLLYDAGLVMVARREGPTRYFDRPDRVVPADIWDKAAQIHPDEADELLFRNYLAAYRLIDAKDGRLGWGRHSALWRNQQLQRCIRRRMLTPLHITGIDRSYYVLTEDQDLLAQLDHEESRWDYPIRFLPPLDNLLWHRERLNALFDFYYRWEVYVPPARRQFGSYAMPILAGDRLIGRIDPIMDRKNQHLIILRCDFESDVRLSRRLTQDLARASETWAHSLGASLVEWPQDLF